jgi:hypothetical protein
MMALRVRWACRMPIEAFQAVPHFAWGLDTALRRGACGRETPCCPSRHRLVAWRPMIHGAHVILYSKDADADRAFFRDVLRYRHADAGHGWLIFALPPAEVAVHPTDGDGSHELYLMCDDVHALIADMKSQGIATSPVHEERWGRLTQITLPSGGKLGIYQPLHASPLKAPARRASGKRPAAKKAKTAKKSAAKKSAPKRKAGAARPKKRGRHS